MATAAAGPIGSEWRQTSNVDHGFHETIALASLCGEPIAVSGPPLVSSCVGDTPFTYCLVAANWSHATYLSLLLSLSFLFFGLSLAFYFLSLSCCAWSGYVLSCVFSLGAAFQQGQDSSHLDCCFAKEGQGRIVL